MPLQNEVTFQFPEQFLPHMMTWIFPSSNRQVDNIIHIQKTIAREFRLTVALLPEVTLEDFLADLADFRADIWVKHGNFFHRPKDLLVKLNNARYEELKQLSDNPTLNELGFHKNESGKIVIHDHARKLAREHKLEIFNLRAYIHALVDHSQGKDLF